MPRRRWLTAVLADLRDGSCSVLEQGYLTLVGRAHCLPRGLRQHRERPGGTRSVYREVHYEGLDTDVELDGRAFHDSPAQRDDDLDRDLDLAAEQRVVLRLGWAQVFRRTCHTAVRVARVLQARGWQDQPVPCGPDCPVHALLAA